MKIAKHARAHRPFLPTIRFSPDVECRARELRLIHQMARNTPTENRRLGKEIARQRHCLRHSLGVARRYARYVARLSPVERQTIRQLQDSPLYVGLGAASALQREDPDETSDIDNLDWLFDDAEASGLSACSSIYDLDSVVSDPKGVILNTRTLLSRRHQEAIMQRPVQSDDTESSVQARA